MKEINEDNLFTHKKLVIFGAKGVGKSSLVQALAGMSFSPNIVKSTEEYSTQYVKHHSKTRQPIHYNIQEVTITDQILDPSLLEVILFQCECALIMIDIINQDSMDKARNLNDIISSLSLPFLTRLMVVNKIDLETERVVSNFELQQYLNSLKDINYFHISLSSMNNVGELFEKMFTVYADNTKFLPSKYIKEYSKTLSSNLTQASLKLVILGNSTVGKTSFYERYFSSIFFETFTSTIGIDKKVRTMKIFNELYSLHVWDTAGQEKYRSIPAKYYCNADGILLIYDICDRKSFNDISFWLKDIQVNSSRNGNDSWMNSMTLYLIGNKIDLKPRAVEYKDAVDFAKKNNIEYHEVSCKWNLNINEVIHNIVFTIYKKANRQEDTEKLISLKTAPTKDKKCC